MDGLLHYVVILASAAKSHSRLIIVMRMSSSIGVVGVVEAVISVGSYMGAVERKYQRQDYDVFEGLNIVFF